MGFIRRQMHRSLLSLPQTHSNYLRTSGGVLCRRSSCMWGDGKQAFRNSERELREVDWHRRNKACHSRCAINVLKHICSFGKDAFIPHEAVSRRIPFSHCSVVAKMLRWRATRSGECLHLAVEKTWKLISFLCENTKSREKGKLFFYVQGLVDSSSL